MKFILFRKKKFFWSQKKKFFDPNFHEFSQNPVRGDAKSVTVPGDPILTETQSETEGEPHVAEGPENITHSVVWVIKGNKNFFDPR